MRTQLPAAIVSVLAAVLGIPATYACLRAYDVLFRSEPNPASVVWSVHIAMFWRIAIGLYVAGMFVPFVFLAARRDPSRAVKVLQALVWVVAALVLLQGLVLP